MVYKDYESSATKSRCAASLHANCFSSIACSPIMRVQDPEVLHDAANATTQIVQLNYQTDTLASLLTRIKTAAGTSSGGLSSIGFIDHAGPNEFLLLHDLAVNMESLKENQELRSFFKEIAQLLLPRPANSLHRTASACSSSGIMGRLDLLGCSLAAEGGKENELIKKLEEICGYNVCASTDLTGDKAKGGNWILETDGIDAAVKYFVPLRLTH